MQFVPFTRLSDYLVYRIWWSLRKFLPPQMQGNVLRGVLDSIRDPIKYSTNPMRGSNKPHHHHHRHRQECSKLHNYAEALQLTPQTPQG
jgi:hypothetical protein